MCYKNTHVSVKSAAGRYDSSEGMTSQHANEWIMFETKRHISRQHDTAVDCRRYSKLERSTHISIPTTVDGSGYNYIIYHQCSNFENSAVDNLIISRIKFKIGRRF